MEQMQTENQCQHQGCKCLPPSTGEYCSENCENAQKGGMDDECKCGHPECSE